MTDEVKSRIETIKEILLLGGELEIFEMDGQHCVVVSYEDPWGAGFVLRYGGVVGARDMLMSAENGEGKFLLRVAFRDGEPFDVITFDTTTAWDLYMGACLADVRINSKK